jgi:hypothetical protein
MVVDGQASDALLDTYTAERAHTCARSSFRHRLRQDDVHAKIRRRRTRQPIAQRPAPDHRTYPSSVCPGSRTVRSCARVAGSFFVQPPPPAPAIRLMRRSERAVPVPGRTPEDLP